MSTILNSNSKRSTNYDTGQPGGSQGPDQGRSAPPKTKITVEDSIGVAIQKLAGILGDSKMKDDQFSKLQTSTQPGKTSSITDYPIGYQAKEGFKHSLDSWSTNIMYNAVEYMNNIPQDLMEMRNTVEYAHGWFFNHYMNYGYQRKFSFIRNTGTKFETHKETYMSETIKPFLKEVFSNIYPKYGLNISLKESNLLKFRCAEEYSDEVDKIHADFLSQISTYTSMTLYGFLDKITDQEIHNAFILSPMYHDHFLNMLLSPAVVSICQFHSKLLSMVKSNSNSPYYSKNSLPKLTYICFTGIYSEIDIDFLTQFSDHIQIIMIYDEKTGGPGILQNYDEAEEVDFRKSQKYYRHISDKILLIPLKTIEGCKNWQPNDIYSIFEQFVFKAVNNFKPECIVFNHSFVFNKTSLNSFYLDEQTVGRITYILSTMCEFRLILFPFKLPELSLTEKGLTEIPLRYRFTKQTSYIDQVKNNKNLDKYQKEKGERRLRYIYNYYAISYDRKYFKDCFVNCVEAMSMLRKYKIDGFLDKTELNINPLVTQNMSDVAAHYKNHSYYGHLFSSTYRSTASFQKHIFKQLYDSQISKQKLFTPNPDQKPLASEILATIKTKNYRKKIPYFDDEGKVASLDLEKISLVGDESSSHISLVLDDDSQFEIDYSKHQEVIRFFLFNALLDHPMTNPENYLITLDKTNATTTAKKIGHPKPGHQIYAAGITYFDGKLYHVYGYTMTEKIKLDRDWVFEYNLKEETWKELQPKGREKAIARHNVNALAFRKDNKIYVYAMGGEVLVNNDHAKNYDIYNLIDKYEAATVTDPNKDQQWIYSKLDKTKLTGPNHLPYIPHINSYSYYDAKNATIVIMGGRLSRASVNEWSFFVFEIDVVKGELSDVKQYINSIEQPQQANNATNPTAVVEKFRRKFDDLVSVADKDRNMYIDTSRNGEVKILYRNKFKYYLTTYDRTNSSLTTKIYESLGIEYVKTKLEEKSAENANKRPDKKQITLPQSIYIGYYFDSPNSKRILDTFVTEIESTSYQLDGETVINTFKDIVSNEKDLPTSDTTKAIQFIENVTKYPELQDIFIAKDDRIKQLKLMVKDFSLNENPILPLSEIVDKMEESKMIGPAKKDIISVISNLKTISDLLSTMPPPTFTQDEGGVQISSNMDSVLKSAGVSETKSNAALNSLVNSFPAKNSMPKKQFPTSTSKQIAHTNPKDSKPISVTKSTKDGTTAPTSLGSKSKDIASTSREKNQHSISGDKDEAASYIEQKKVSQQEKSVIQERSAREEQSLSGSKQAPHVDVEVDEPQPPTKIKTKKMQHIKRVKEEFIDIGMDKEYASKVLADFKECLESKALANCKMFFNSSVTELTIDNGNMKVRAGINVWVEDRLEKLSFKHAPYSCSIFNSAVVFYMDRYFEDSNPQAYAKYQNFILYCNLDELTDTVNEQFNPSETKGGNDEVLVDICLKPLFLVNKFNDVVNRGVLVTSNSIFMFGGSSYSLDDENPRILYSRVFKYDLSKDPSSSKFETELRVDLEEKACGFTAVQDKDYIYVCARENPTYLHIFKQDGPRKKVIKFPYREDLFRVHMNIVQWGAKPKLLFSIYQPLYESDKEYKEFEYKLLDLEKETWRDVDLAARSDLPHMQYHTEKVSFVHNTGIKPLDRIYRRLNLTGELDIVEFDIIDKSDS